MGDVATLRMMLDETTRKLNEYIDKTVAAEARARELEERLKAAEYVKASSVALLSRFESYPGQMALWDAINEVVVASGGSADNTSAARQKAVVAVETAVRAMLATKEQAPR